MYIISFCRFCIFRLLSVCIYFAHNLVTEEWDILFLFGTDASSWDVMVLSYCVALMSCIYEYQNFCVKIVALNGENFVAAMQYGEYAATTNYRSDGNKSGQLSLSSGHLIKFLKLSRYFWRNNSSFF